jgi:hypothetical protein
MPDLAVIPLKRDRRGGWNRNAPVRDVGLLEAPAASQDPIAFINSLTHTKGAFARQTFNLRPWQVRIIKRLFKKRPDGRRQYRTCLLMLPRKNGKTELAAAIALYGLLADGEAGAEVYSAAADRDQASLVFGVAAQMVRNDAALEGACHVVESQKRIVHASTGSFYRAIAAEAHSKHGFNASMVIYDELHAAPDRRLYDVLSTSMGAREQPLLLVISTAGYDRHSILWELYAHAKKVQERPALARGDADLGGPREADSRAGKQLPPLVFEPVDRAGRALDSDAGLGRLPDVRGRPPGAPQASMLRRDGPEHDDRPDGDRGGLSRRARLRRARPVLRARGADRGTVPPRSRPV